MPGGLQRGGDGWKLSVRVRMIHAQVRYLLKSSEDWDTGAWGVPLSAAHVGFAITAFSARLLKHMKNLGAEYNSEERKSFMEVWRYSGYLMGIPETILFRDEQDALRLFEIGLMCEPPPEVESVVMANSLIHSAPLVIGVEKPAARRNLAKYVFSISRAHWEYSCRSSDVPSRLDIWSPGMVPNARAISPHCGKDLARTYSGQQFHQIYLSSGGFGLRRGRHQLQITRPRLRRGIRQVVNCCCRVVRLVDPKGGWKGGDPHESDSQRASQG